MASSATDYDRRYLGGILFFNDRDFFQAHEVWEDLWMDSAGPERRFYQALIQAAVALYHFGNGNLRGAIKLFHSSRDYMKPYPPKYLGLDTVDFWRQMEGCFAEVFAQADPHRDLRPVEERMPVITLDPAPDHWPELAEFEGPEGAA